MNRRRWLAVALAVALVSCGGDDGSPPPLLDGFSVADQGALVVPATDCTGTLGFTVSALLLGFSSFPGLCGFVQDTALCGDVASSTTVTVSVLRGRLTSPAPAPIGPGTYPISLTGIPFDEGGGNFRLVLADVTKTDATCGEPSPSPAPTGGSLVLTSVGPTNVTGSVDVTFDDGGRFQRDFDLSVCVSAVDACAVLDDSCATPVCCPTAATCP